MKYIYVFLILSIVGCSNKGTYEGMQASNRLECSKLPPTQYEECMQNANKTFEEYERERRELLEQ